MLTTKPQAAPARPLNVASIAARAATAVRWPFTSRFASPIWLAVRLYMSYMWLMMGLTKIGAGFLTSDPIGGMLGLVATGTLPVPFAFYRPVAQMLVSLGVTPLLSHSMPFLEMAIALSFATGVLVVPAAIGATLLNINFILAGIGQIRFDGRFIAIQLLLVLAFRVVGTIGFQRLIVRIARAAIQRLRHTAPSTATPA